MEELNELEELRLRIAIRQGYRVATFGEGYATLFPPGESLPNGAEMLDLADYIDSVPDWPNDLTTAWELVEEAERAGVGFELSNILHALTGVIEYEATFFDPWGGPMSEKYKATASTAADAIARAFYDWRKS
jgi:hypothetical protein